MSLVVGGVTVTGTQTLDASKLTGTASAINGSNITNLPAPSTANVASATAGISGGVVGSYAYCLWNQSPTSELTIGSTKAGSDLRFSNSGGNNSGTPSGTWKIMGYIEGNRTSHQDRTVLWLRIS
jgi:hypothetical protein